MVNVVHGIRFCSVFSYYLILCTMISSTQQFSGGGGSAVNASSVRMPFLETDCLLIMEDEQVCDQI